MCSIYGMLVRPGAYSEQALGRLHLIKLAAKDRGRDGGRHEHYDLKGEYKAVLGNWRAIPTPELSGPDIPLQPYDRYVHNGTIANDEELGTSGALVDSMVLPQVLDNTNIDTFAESLKRLKGSYAIATANDETVLLACNYKPLYYAEVDGVIYFSSMSRHLEKWLPFGHSAVKLEPYTALDLRTQESRNLWPDHNRRKTAVVAASGGLDSTVVAAQLVHEGYEVHLAHILYGCLAEESEHSRIAAIADRLGAKSVTLELPLKTLLGQQSSTLFGDDDSQIGQGKAGAEFAVDWVPARNLMMLSLLTAYAEANGLTAIALGNNLEEGGTFPDNEEEFTHLFGQLLPNACAEGVRVNIRTPVANLMKHEIVELGLMIDAPLEFTWSCYTTGEQQCGHCTSCYMRRIAFQRNGVMDPGFYHEWREVPFWNDGINYYDREAVKSHIMNRVSKRSV